MKGQKNKQINKQHKTKKKRQLQNVNTFNGNFRKMTNLIDYKYMYFIPMDKTESLVT